MNEKKNEGMIHSDVAIVKSEVVRIRNDIDKLLKIIVEGNGHSLVSKMAVVEMKLDTIEEEMKKSERNTYSIKLAVFSGVLSLITSLAVFVTQLLIRGGK